MDTKELLQLVAEKKVSVDDALLELKKEPFEDLGFAKPDFHRKLRQGVGEVIYGAGKTPDQIAKISESFIKNNQSNILITRMSKEASDYVEKYLEALEVTYFYDETSKVGIFGNLVEKDGLGKIVVATGGTSDMPVAEEAALTAEFLGNHVERLYDVGVAGLHRLLENVDKIMEAKVIIAIAGMEGALASVIGGLADCPVIAVPTSVGYGAAFGGITPLLSMLNSCASGVSVVNIDNGFGAGYMAHTINCLGGKK